MAWHIVIAKKVLALNELKLSLYASFSSLVHRPPNDLTGIATLFDLWFLPNPGSFFLASQMQTSSVVNPASISFVFLRKPDKMLAQ